MKLNKSLLLSILIFIYGLSGFTQVNDNKGYFLFPINPGQTNYLAANMGELRTNHFHGGIDVKTGGKIGYNVYASAEGYVVRIKVSTFGYGNVVYIRHPNNLVTVYAHLDKFNTSIGDYLRKKQYEKQSFDIEIYPDKNDLPVKRGEVIGLAGNTGSSEGPHLHYEIRDTNDRVLNPSNFGFTEIKDNIKPVFEKIAITTFDLDSRVNNEFGRLEFKAIKSGTQYTIPKIQANGFIGIELKAIDRKNEVHNSFGIPHIQVWVDDKEIFKHDLDSYTFDETRYINTHINYPAYISSGRRFERLYIADGNKLSTYTTDVNKGRIQINDSKIHKVKILIKDDFNNSSILTFDIQGKPCQIQNIPLTSLANQKITTDVIDNTLKISTLAAGDPGAEIFFKRNSTKLTPAYAKAGQVVYLYDLRKGMPDSIKIGSQKEIFNFLKMLPPGQEQKISSDNFSLFVPSKTFADTVYFQYQKEIVNNNEIYTIHNKSVPMFDTLTLTVNPSPKIADKSKTYLYSGNSSKLLFEGGEWKGNKIEAKTRNLGKFTVTEDSVKPVVRLISHHSNSIQFNIHDHLSGIKSFRATLDGYWLLMNYDHKRRLIWSERLDKTVPLKGKFELEVKDNAGNSTMFNIEL